MPFSGEFFLFFVLLFGVGPTAGNDYLDTIPTAAYWDAKNVSPALEQLQADASSEKIPDTASKLVKDLSSEDFKTRNEAKKELARIGPSILPLLKPALDSKDPEIESAAKELATQFSNRSREREIRRLMAIRTLGERKEKAALPLLRGLVESKDLFVSDYARRAVAVIEGHDVPHADHQKEVQQDLSLLPKEVTIVIQAKGNSGEPLLLDKIMKHPPLSPSTRFDNKQALAKITGNLVAVVDRVGNLRIDGMTVGMSEVGNEKFWMILVLRGKYDAAAMIATATTADAKSVSVSRNGRTDVVTALNGWLTMLLPSEDQFVIILGEAETKTGVVNKVIGFLNGQKRDFDENTSISNLMKSTDTTGSIWGVAFFNSEMRRFKSFEAFETVTFSTKKENGDVRFVFTAQGSDAEKMKSSAAALSANFQATSAKLKEHLDQNPETKEFLTVLESIKITTKGTTGTMTGEIKTAALPAIIAESSGMIGAAAQMVGKSK